MNRLRIGVGATMFVLLLGAGCTQYKKSEPDAQTIQSPSTVILDPQTAYTLEAKEARHAFNDMTVPVFAYNGSIPGPVLKGKQGETVEILFKNALPMQSSLHAHGLRMENKFDGVPGVTQDEIEPGASFMYRLSLKDPGLYWYHPHTREDWQQELGLSGFIWVEPSESNYFPEVDHTEFLMLDDIALSKHGVETFDETVVDHALMGRFGNTLLVNGQTTYQFDTVVGTRVRFGFGNAANVRPFHIGIEDHQFKVVGSDNGRVTQEQFVDSLLIAPSERYIADVLFDRAGTFVLEHRTPEQVYALGTVVVHDTPDSQRETKRQQFSAVRTNALDGLSSQEIERYADRNPDHILRLSVDTDMMHMNDSGMDMPCHAMPDGTMMGDCGQNTHDADGSSIEWEDEMGVMNAMATNDLVTWQLIDEQTGAVNEHIDWQFSVGQYAKIRIMNDDTSVHPMQHPFHMHGQRFIVLETNGVRNTQPMWKDTVLIPSGDTVDILVEMSNPGTWVAHCHIPEHMHSGMMMQFKVDA